MEDLLVLPRAGDSLQSRAGFSRKTRNILGLLKSGLSRIKRAAGEYARAAFAKRKSNRAVCPKHQMVRWERVKVSWSRTLPREREGSEREHGEERDSKQREHP